MTDQTSTDIRLAFLDILVFEDGSIRGGVLITDLETRPYEFRVTSPVKPTPLQRVLYGRTLVDYVYGDLICLPLIWATKEKLSLAIVRHENLLIIRPNISIPMIYINQNSKSNNNDQNTDGIRPIIIKPHRNFPGEEAWAETLLTNIMQRHELLEPFERLKTAISEVNKKN